MTIGYHIARRPLAEEVFVRFARGVSLPVPPGLADVITGSSEPETLEGTEEADTLNGRAGNDILNGNGGDDILIGGAGRDTIDGGAGLDIVSYEGTRASVTLDLRPKGLSTSYVRGLADDTIRGVEGITGGSAGDFLGIYGTKGRIDGGAGDDVIFINTVNAAGETGRLRIDGGAGAHDLLDLSRLTRGATLNQGQAIRQLFAGIEDVQGSHFADTINGNSASNILHGGDGGDFLTSYASLGSPDFLYGDEGDDTLSVGGEHFGEFHGGAGDDSLILRPSSSNSAGSLLLDGGQGIDTIRIQLSGAVFMLGATGEGSFTTASGTTGQVLSIENVVGSDFDDDVTGGNGTNILVGGNGADILQGAGGDDILIGNLEFVANFLDATDGDIDILNGGTGTDTFRFEGTGHRSVVDRITDFSQAEQDRIDLSIIDANTHVRGNDAFVFIGTAAFGQHSGELRYEISNGNTLVMMDTNGDGVSDLTIQLDGLYQLTIGDFDL